MLPWVAVAIAAASLQAAPDTARISGANTADTCQFPSVVSFDGGTSRCTGTLVHPRVVVTAAHCLDGTPTRMRFGESYSPFERGRDVDHCEVSPQWAESGAIVDDFAFCVLTDPFDGVPLTPLLASCETQVLTRDTIAAIVGFGLPSVDGVFGTKRYAFTRLSADVQVNDLLSIGDSEVNGCLGDSGGPAFVQLEDGSWRVVGVLVQAPACGDGPAEYRVLASETAWIEERSGFDVTPCFDAAGEWTDCDGIDADPREHAEAWDGACDGPRVAPQPTCEPVVDPSTGTGSSSGAAESSSTGGAAETSTGAASSQSSGTSGTPAAPPSGGDGCSCGTGSPTATAWWMLLAVVAVRRRYCWKQ